MLYLYKLNQKHLGQSKLQASGKKKAKTIPYALTSLWLSYKKAFASFEIYGQ